MDAPPPQHPVWPNLECLVRFDGTMWQMDFGECIHNNTVSETRVFPATYLGVASAVPDFSACSNGLPFIHQLMGPFHNSTPYSATQEYIVKISAIATVHVRTGERRAFQNGDLEKMFERERIVVNALRIKGLGRYGCIPYSMFHWIYADDNGSPWAMQFSVTIMERYEYTLDSVMRRLGDVSDVEVSYKIANVLGEKVIAAIEMLNAEGILHRDLKCDNVAVIPCPGMDNVPFEKSILFAEVRIFDWNTAFVFNDVTRRPYAMEKLYDFRDIHGINTNVDKAMFQWNLAFAFAVVTKIGTTLTPYAFQYITDECMSYFIVSCARKSQWAHYNSHMGRRWIALAEEKFPKASDTTVVMRRGELRGSYGPRDVTDVN